MASLELDTPQPWTLRQYWPGARKAVGLLLLAALAFGFIIPILWMTVMSFQAGEKMFQLRTEWIPSVWHFENYPNAWSRAPFAQYFLNSGIVSLAVMVGNVVCCTLAGYGLAKFRFPGSGLVLLLILSTLMLPLEVTLVPTFLVIHKFGWINSYQGIVSPLLIDAFGVFLMRQSMISIPKDYIEAARIDGAGRFRTAVSLTIPMIRDNIQTAYVYLGILALDAFVYMAALFPNAGGPENTTLVMSQQLFFTAFQRGQFGTATAMGVVMAVATLIFSGLVFLVNRLTGGKDQELV